MADNHRTFLGFVNAERTQGTDTQLRFKSIANRAINQHRTILLRRQTEVAKMGPPGEIGLPSRGTNKGGIETMSENLLLLASLLEKYSEQKFDKWGLTRRLTTSEQVFERFVGGLLDGMVRVEILEKMSKLLFSTVSEVNALQRYDSLFSHLQPDEAKKQFREWVFNAFRQSGIAGLFKWERAADGILEITLLAKQFGGLINLYPALLKLKGAPKIARHEVLQRILDIPGVRDKKALVLLRDLHFQCGWDYPLDDLPMPVDTHIQIVMRRMGYVKGKKKDCQLQIQSAARAYFRVPVIADLAIWDIGKQFCPKTGVTTCNTCIATEYCEKVLD